DAHSVLVKREGTCDGYSAAFQLLCRLAGVESLIIRGKTGGRHSWNMVRVDGQWRHIDVTWDDPLPDTPCRVVYDYFMLTDSQISKDHSWEGDYPAAR
ncbi:MAG: transglutaminase domain-containing protein, partial [Pyramidobacter sp.]|nr:transglutaminase domain-containing protein [Pyramidobacter sp.]